MSPMLKLTMLTIEETVKSLSCIFSVSQSTFLRVLRNITACVIVKVSYKSHKVSNFHSCKTIKNSIKTSIKTAGKNNLMTKIADFRDQ